MQANAADMLMERIEDRLGGRDLIGVSEVADACSVGVSTVYTWIECGAIEAVNISVARRPYYKVFRNSVVKFMRERLS